MLLSDSPSWRAAAACAGLPPAVVFSRRAQQAAPALRACAVCPVRRECEQAVAPAESWFDGVCAGRLWRNGRPAPAARTSRTAKAARVRPAPGATAGAATDAVARAATPAGTAEAAAVRATTATPALTEAGAADRTATGAAGAGAITSTPSTAGSVRD
ncbi:WhiB family transcriptional regulator [Streptomyces vilmorinianum]|uniref:WhiB family transcriptional regulator n=1 Tax=Streptomyces vilmorinianum TaxID=3051092 RepID=UPI00158616B4|nr:WhiB family transcriptional regulator [Streptomyces vilmorinianum]